MGIGRINQKNHLYTFSILFLQVEPLLILVDLVTLLCEIGRICNFLVVHVLTEEKHLKMAKF